MSRDEAFRQCIEAFAVGNYEASVQLAWALVREGPTLHTLQLLLIGLQRLGREEELKDLGSQALDVTSEYPWDQSLLRVTLGKSDPQEVLEQAADGEQRCQVMFYAGARMQSLGEIEQAKRILAACVEQENDCLEHMLAQYALEGIAEQLDEQFRFVQQIEMLHQQGRIQEMRDLAQQALDLTRQQHGEDSPFVLVYMNNLAAAERELGNPAAAELLYRHALDL